MRVIPAAFILGLTAFIPSHAWAQAEQSFENLANQVKVGTRIRVEDRSGATTTGRLISVSAEQIVIETGTGERPFPRETVASVDVWRRYARRGALVGAAVGAVAFIPFTQGEHGDPDAFVLGGLLGAGAGAIAGALIRRHTTVYRAEGASSPSFAIRLDLSGHRVGVRAGRSW